MLFLFSSVLLLLPLPTSTLVALGEPQLAHNVICSVVYLANNKKPHRQPVARRKSPGKQGVQNTHRTSGCVRSHPIGPDVRCG